MEQLQRDVKTIDTRAHHTRIGGPCRRIVGVNRLVGLGQTRGGADLVPCFRNFGGVRESRSTILSVGHVVEIPSHHMTREKGEITNGRNLVDPCRHRSR